MTSAPNPFATEVSLTELSGELLRARVARAQLYLIDAKPVPGAVAPSEGTAREHLAYLYKLEMEGRLYGCGPIDGDAAHELAIVAAPSREDAESIAANEPLQRAGLRANTVRGYTMNEGVACYVGRAMSRRALSLAPFVADVSGVGLSLEALRARAAGARLQLVWLDPTEKPRPLEDTRTMDAHFVWLRENEMAAKLMNCGPVQPVAPLGNGIWGGGLGVVATPRQEAEHIATVEPSGRAGYRVLSVQPWTLDYGLAAPIAKALEALNRL